MPKKKDRANRLYINVLVLAISWVPLVRSPIEKYLFQKAYSLLTFASIDHLDVNLILISVLFLASGLLFSMASSSPVKRIVFRLLKKPFFGRFMVPWKNPLPEEERKN